MGMRAAERRARSLLGGDDITDWTTRQRREAGIGYIPRTGTGTGCCSRRRCGRTASSATRPSAPNARGLLIDRGRRPRATPSGSSTDYDVRTPGIDVAAVGAVRRQPAEADRRPRDERRAEAADRRAPDPRRRRRRAGRDLGPPPRRPARDGLAVLLISADLDELIGLSDTLRVILRGRLVADVDPATVTPEELGSAMTGAGTREHERGRIEPATGSLLGPSPRRSLAHRCFAVARHRRVRAARHRATRPRPTVPRCMMRLRHASRDSHGARSLNQATTYYLSALAVAIGFRMNLFNIGVDGQYRLAALLRRRRRRRGRTCPGRCTSPVIIVVAMVVGAVLGRRSPALLKVTRGVSEVISTIMLNCDRHRR